MWPFGKKVACFQCDKKVKLAATKLRRGFRFCSDACVEAFLAANVLRPRPGVAESEYTHQAVMELGAAVGELNRLLGSERVTIAGSAGSILGAISAAQAIQQLEDAKDAVYRYSDHVTNALPFLYALGRTADCEYLECVDLESVGDMSALGAGPLQNAKIRNLVRPVAERVARIAESL